ncbi:MAG TPA: KpsF/GutQ family sugar-phosphate isomerase [Pirellulaceae bacterium]|nr:KpsF/GutQ family sugar-phosphate isomerase [Pirellulaceae bacterium]
MEAKKIKLTKSTAFERLRFARDVIKQEFEALQRLYENMPVEFNQAVDIILECPSNLVVSGIGKAGWIAQKLSATFASTGTPSIFLHPSEAMHGDLGRVRPTDVILILSNSGETTEVLQMLPTFKRQENQIIAMTGGERNTLANNATCVLNYGQSREACALGLAPSTSTALMLAMGDALALVVADAKDFSSVDFAKFHPGGSLGRKLTSVRETMRTLAECRVANQAETIRQAYTRCSRLERRTGAIMIVDANQVLCGLFTDSDLARLLEKGRDEVLDQPIGGNDQEPDPN